MKKCFLLAVAFLCSAALMAQLSVTIDETTYTSDATIDVTEIEEGEDGIDPFPYYASLVGTVDGVSSVKVTINRSYEGYDEPSAPYDEFCLGNCFESDHTATQVLQFNFNNLTPPVCITHCYFADQTPCTKTIAYTFASGLQSLTLTVNYVMGGGSALDQIELARPCVHGKTVTFQGVAVLYNIVGCVVASGEGILVAPEKGVFVLRQGSHATKLYIE